MNQDINGLLFADKTGEIKFLNTNNLSKLTKVEDVPGRNEDRAETFDYVSKLIYGHQESVTSMQLSPCKRYLVSTDTMNKVIVNNFPNVYNILSVNTD